MKLALSAGALALSMALAGCGGGGSSTQNAPRGNTETPETEENTQTPTAAMCAENGEVLQGMACADMCSDNYTANNDGLCVADPPRNLAGGDIAKALRTALMAGDADGNLGTDPNEAQVTGTHRTITVAGDDEPDISLKKDMDVSVDPLGDWKGDHYAGDDTQTGDDKHTGMLRAYSNKEDPEMVAFATGGADALPGITEAGGIYTISTADTAAPHVRGDGFASAGTKTHTVGAQRTVPGTYMGASGTYTCSGATCESRWGTGGDITLITGTWVFAPDQGAMRAVADTGYLEFGWWKREDSDDEATHATAYARLIPGSGDSSAAAVDLGTRQTGSATYMGKAAGLFAIRDTQRSQDDDSGHFTADAMLKATFSGAATGSTLEGEITKFRLDDGNTDPGWSVKLKKVTYDDSNTDFRGGKTEWTTSAGKGDAGGNWGAEMYDTNKADNSSLPDSVAGTFHSAIGETHQMRGAFGAEK